MTGLIQWNARKAVGTKQEAWYDRTTWHVPFTGEYDQAKVSNAIRPRVSNQFVELSTVRRLDAGTVEFETLYKIGD